MTVYLCPVCGAEMLRVRDPKPSWAPGAKTIQDAVQIAMTAHYEAVELALLAALDSHDCAHPLRWRLWRWRQRDEIAQAHVWEAKVTQP